MDKDFLKGLGVTAAVIGGAALLRPKTKRNPSKKTKKKTKKKKHWTEKTEEYREARDSGLSPAGARRYVMDIYKTRKDYEAN